VYEQIPPQDHRVLELRLLHNTFHFLIKRLQGLIVACREGGDGRGGWVIDRGATEDL
jgi:hypothetical protein